MAIILKAISKKKHSWMIYIIKKKTVQAKLYKVMKDFCFTNIIIFFSHKKISFLEKFQVLHFNIKIQVIFYSGYQFSFVFLDFFSNFRYAPLEISFLLA